MKLLFSARFHALRAELDSDIATSRANALEESANIIDQARTTAESGLFVFFGYFSLLSSFLHLFVVYFGPQKQQLY